MKPINLSGAHEYLAILARRKWWIIAPFLLLSSTILLLTHALPHMYVSEALILIRPRDVPEDFVKDLIAGTTQERLSAIEQTVLSRSNLIQILHEFEGSLPEYKALNMDQRFLKLKSQIHVTFETGTPERGRGAITYFRLSYQNRSPELAQKITAKLTSLFIDQDSKAREIQVFGTTEFLHAELEKKEEELKQSDTKLKEIRARRRFELPDQLETNLRTLERLNLAKQANQESLDRYQGFRLNLERVIAETPPTIPRPMPPTTPKAKNSFIDDYKKKQAEIRELTAKYTEKHHDVIVAQAELAQLKVKLSPEDLASLNNPTEKEPTAEATATMPNPAYQSLTTQLHDVNTEFAIREREKKTIADDIASVTARVQNTPQGEQDIAEVLRQNTDLNKSYEEMKNHYDQAKLSESLESRQKGSQFVVVDPANYPLSPAKPAKYAIALGGVIVSLAAGVAVALGLEIVNGRVWTPSEVETLLGSEILVEVPEIETASDAAVVRKRRLKFIASSMAIAGAHAVLLYVIYIMQASVIARLDPILQKLYS